MEHSHFYENELVKTWVEDDIVFVQFKATKVDLPTAQALIDHRLENFAGKFSLYIIDINNVKSITREARLLFASKQAVSHVKASALYSNSIFTNLIANFFLNFNKPLVPIKLFSDINDARVWLSTFNEEGKGQGAV